MSLYGTRDAAMNWQEEVAREMTRWGFRRGEYNPCPYHHPGLGIMTLVHGDDFMSVGSVQALAKFKADLESRFEIKTQAIGPDDAALRINPSGASEGLGIPVVQEGRCLRGFCALLSMEMTLEVGWLNSASTHHQIDSRRISKQPEAVGG